ncbi:MAG: EAL domain-containing protein [Arenicellales bacterium]
MLQSDNTDTHRIWQPGDAQRRIWASLHRVDRTLQLLGLTIAIASAFLFLPLVGPTIVFSWLTAYAAVAIVRLYYTHDFLSRQSAPRDIAARKWGFVLGVALTGLMWGATIFVYRTDWPGPYQGYMFLVFAGLISTAATAYAASLPVFAVFTAMVLGPPFLRLGLSEFPSSSKFALLVLLYGCLMFFIARSIHERMRSLIGLQLANTDLAENLAEVNQDLDLEIEQRSVVEDRLWRERKLFLDGPVVVFRWRNEPGWPIEYVSPNVRQFGLDPADLRSVPYARFIHPQDLSLVDKVAPIEGLDAKHPALTKDYRLMLRDGEVRWVYDHTIPVYDSGDRVTHYDGYILDITERKTAEQSILSEKERIQVTLQSIGDGVITTDSENAITYLNPAAETLTGMPLEDARGHELTEVFRLRDPKQDQPLSDAALGLDGTAPKARRSARLLGADGAVRDVTYTVAPITGEAGDRIGLVVGFHDASESIAMAHELAYQASHDSLTGTLNRRAFESRLREALATARESRTRHTLIYIDLDQFKVINDTYGHHAGDRFLLRVADGLSRIVSDPNELARLGGDEFAVLVYDCPANRARSIAVDLKNYIQGIRYQWQRRVFTVSASMGIAEINGKSVSVEQILSAADMACYAAKDAGRNRIQIYRESDSEIRRRHSEMQWITRIQSALDADQLLLYAQRIEPVPMPRDPVARQEILVRLVDQDGELIPASTFLPAAERYNLSPLLDRWVIRECLKSIRAIPEPRDAVYFINVSGISLGRQDFLRYIKEQFDEFQVPGSQVCFEITESAAISNLRFAIKFVADLKSMGCHFALDDFGRGLSSFAYLKELSVDYLKIDGSFVQNIVDDTLDHALVEAINQVGHVMLIDTIAEHVENALTFEEVKKIGIDYAQGNYVQKPEPLPGQSAKMERLRQA